MLNEKFILDLSNLKLRIKITEEEYKGIISTKDDGSFFLSRLGILAQKRFVTVAPISIADQLEDRQNQKIGYCSDGTRAVRHFGQWVVDEGQVPDDQGNYKPIKLDPSYYPEVARDCLFTPEEWEQVKSLSTTQRQEKIMNLNGGRPNDKKIYDPNKDFSSIGGILKSRE